MSRPYKLPWTLKTFGSFGKLIFGVVMLAEALLHIGSLAAVVSTGGLTLNYIDPERHTIVPEKLPQTKTKIKDRRPKIQEQISIVSSGVLV